jgi:hypothetical protein|tara:strand:+ start:1034 stop:1429 length:396 start_codon:yes stop_codon:yes gene_type:complete
MSAIGDFATGLIAPVTGLISEYIVDKDKAAQLAHDIASLAGRQAHEQQLAQLGVAKETAKHKSIFVAGARPAIMWICGIGLGYNVLAYPILDIWYEMPPVQTDLLYPVLLGMLGLGGMRSFDKMHGVAREQ